MNPPLKLVPYPDVLERHEFRADNSQRQIQWRVDLFRRLDPNHPFIAHGTVATIGGLATDAKNDWRAAAKMDLYGLTWVA